MSDGSPLIVNADLTGMVRTQDKNANVPVTPDENAADAQRVCAAGAAIVHPHAHKDETEATRDEGIEDVRERFAVERFCEIDGPANRVVRERPNAP